MTEEVAKIKANKDGTYIDIVPEKCVSAQKAQYDENGRDLLDAESSQTIKGANTFAAKQTYTGGVAVSGTSAIAGNVSMDSGAVAIGSAVSVENHGKITADNTANVIKAANHNSVLTSNDILTAKDINEVNGTANNLLHRSGDSESLSKPLVFESQLAGSRQDRIRLKVTNYDSTSESTTYRSTGGITFRDQNDVVFARLDTYVTTNNQKVLQLAIGDAWLSIVQTGTKYALNTNCSKPSNW